MNTGQQAGKRKEYFLAELRKAEELAARATTPDARAEWLKIADGYRHLAGLAQKN